MTGPCPSTPKGVVALALRLSFGLTLLFVGIDHYIHSPEFVTNMVASGLGPLEAAGTLWGYILPALQIIGGACIATGYAMHTGVWAAGLALGSIPVGMVLKAVLSGTGDPGLSDVMPMINNTWLWLITFALVVKCSCCGSCSDGK